MHARWGEQLCSSRHHCLSIHSHRRWTRQVPGRLPWVKTRKDLSSDTGGSGSGTLSPCHPICLQRSRQWCRQLCKWRRQKRYLGPLLLHLPQVNVICHQRCFLRMWSSYSWIRPSLGHHCAVKGILTEASSRRLLPISPEVMTKLHKAWSSGCYDSCMLWAMACAGFLRSGEFLPRRSADSVVSGGSGFSHLSVNGEDIFYEGKDRSVWQGRQHIPGAERHTSVPSSSSARIPRGPPSALFVWEDFSPLTRYQFVRRVNQALQAAGIDASCYSGHSFEIEAATAAAKSRGS